MLLPKDLTWFVVFEFEDVGYVKDDEKKSLDAGAMLSSIKTNTDRANQVRRQNGGIPSRCLVGSSRRITMKSLTTWNGRRARKTVRERRLPITTLATWGAAV